MESGESTAKDDVAGEERSQ